MSKATNAQLTENQRAELEALKAMPDQDIDYSDIPPNTPGQWQDASVGRFYQSAKDPLTLPIDADVLAWFKAQGGDYPARINALLRQVMLKDAHRAG